MEDEDLPASSRLFSAVGHTNTAAIFRAQDRTSLRLRFEFCCWLLGVSFLLHLHITRQDCRDLALHEGPRHVGAHKGALLPTGTVHLVP